MRTAVFDQCAQVVQKLVTARLPQRQLFRGQFRLERAENRERPAPQVVPVFLRYRQQARNDLDRHARSEVFDQVDFVAAGETLGEFVEQLATTRSSTTMVGSIVFGFSASASVARTRVIWRIVEDEAGGVVTEQRAGAELRSEQTAFVGAEVRVAVDLQTVVVTGHEIRTIRTAMDRVGLAKRCVPRKRIVDEPAGGCARSKWAMSSAGGPYATPLPASRRPHAVRRQRAPEECRQRFDLRDGLIRRIHDQQS